MSEPLLFFSFQLVVSSSVWMRYIYIYIYICPRGCGFAELLGWSLGVYGSSMSLLSLPLVVLLIEEVKLFIFCLTGLRGHHVRTGVWMLVGLLLPVSARAIMTLRLSLSAKKRSCIDVYLLVCLSVCLSVCMFVC